MNNEKKVCREGKASLYIKDESILVVHSFVCRGDSEFLYVLRNFLQGKTSAEE